MMRLGWWKTLFLLSIFCAARASASRESFKTLVEFKGPNGSAPASVFLIQGLDGNLYGTTYAGGANCLSFGGCGTVFKVTPSGQLTTLYSFCQHLVNDACTDGAYPYAGLIQGTDGNFYGTTFVGGEGGYGGVGTVFKITPTGVLTTIYSFCSQTNCTDGSYPRAGLVQGTDGIFYGTTSEGGTNGQPNGWGTIFEVSSTGTLKTLYNFCSQANCADGTDPSGGLVQGPDGNFYGTTREGGGYPVGVGTVFQITPQGVLTTLHVFTGEPPIYDGANPYAGLFQGTNGNFYGTTIGGGVFGFGTVFDITPEGTLVTIHSFDDTDGSSPFAGVAEGTTGNFYGATTAGGADTTGCDSNGCGTVFMITPEGTLTTLHSFNNADGASPFAAPFQGTDGIFYGTSCGQACPEQIKCCRGALFAFSQGLEPFVETLPASGNAGETVHILGTDLKGARMVSFNGTAAKFIVVSATEIKTTVPAGASTGFVTVTTPSGALKSNKTFAVIP
jgi:uncharacterized repeat protein (TIGR03803 family)